MAVVFGGSAVAAEPNVPVFESGRYQFTLMRPQLQIPPIRLFRLEGGTVELTALRGKPILLNFWGVVVRRVQNGIAHSRNPIPQRMAR